MRALLIALFVLSGCVVPDYYARLENPAEANICVAKLLGQPPMTTLPRFFVEPAPWWITYRGERVKVYGTFWRGILPYHDVIRVADGSRMAEAAIHEFGKRFGLNAEDARALIRRMEECR